MARIGSRIKTVDAYIELAKIYNDNSTCLFDIELLIRSHGINVVYSNNLPPEVSSSLNKVGDDWIIVINKSHALHRKRFAMAHEFAHYCLHRKKRTQFEDITLFKFEGQSDNIEMQASKFAAELLMPEVLIRSEINKGVTAVSNLAEIFGVSPLAMKFRLKNIGFVFKQE